MQYEALCGIMVVQGENVVHQDSLEKIKSELLNARKARRDFYDVEVQAAQKKFDENSGCDSCRGRGWVVTWDTLDSMSGCYAEYGDCPNENCSNETRLTSGLSPQNNKYDKIKGSLWYHENDDEEKRLDQEIIRLEGEEANERTRLTPEAGKIVKIIKKGRGRAKDKSPVGTEGIVIKRFFNDWGTEKLIVLDRDGIKHWPTAKSVEVIHSGSTPEEWQSVIDSARESDGLPFVVTVKHSSGRAALVRTTTGKELWIPFSQSPELKGVKKRDTISVIIPLWLAKDKGLYSG